PQAQPTPPVPSIRPVAVGPSIPSYVPSDIAHSERTPIQDPRYLDEIAKGANDIATGLVAGEDPSAILQRAGDAYDYLMMTLNPKNHGYGQLVRADPAAMRDPAGHQAYVSGQTPTYPDGSPRPGALFEEIAKQESARVSKAEDLSYQNVYTALDGTTTDTTF